MILDAKLYSYFRGGLLKIVGDDLIYSSQYLFRSWKTICFWEDKIGYSLEMNSLYMSDKSYF
jgi:hypothetical protein